MYWNDSSFCVLVLFPPPPPPTRWELESACNFIRNTCFYIFTGSWPFLGKHLQGLWYSLLQHSAAIKNKINREKHSENRIEKIRWPPQNSHQLKDFCFLWDRNLKVWNFTSLGHKHFVEWLGREWSAWFPQGNKTAFFFFLVCPPLPHLGSVEIWEGVFALEVNKATCFI